MKKTILFITALLMIAALFAGCSSAKSESAVYDTADHVTTEEAAAEAPAPMAMEEPVEMTQEEANALAAGETGAKYDSGSGMPEELDRATYVENDRKLIYTAYFSIETMDYVSDYNKVMAALKNAKGFVSTRNSSGKAPQEYGDSGRSTYFSLRIPIDSYNAFIDEIGGVGETMNMEESTEDVTASYYDNEARIELYTAHYEKLMSYLDKATTMEDTMAIENQITEVLYTLDSLKGNQRYLDNLIQYSTVDINLQEVVEITKVVTSKDTLGTRIAESFNSVIKWLGRFFEGFAVVFIAALPILAILTAIFLAIFLPIRASRKKKKARAAAQQVKTPENE